MYNSIIKIKQEKKDPVNQKYADKFLKLYKKFLEAYKNNEYNVTTYKEICKDKIYIDDSEYNKIDKTLLDAILGLNAALE